MKYILSGIIGYFFIHVFSLFLPTILKGKDARAVAATKGELTVDVKPMISLSAKKDEPQIKFLPQYPVDAVNEQIEGSVTLNFTISRKGSVTNLKVVDSYPPQVFDETALNAVSKWVFPVKRIIPGEQTVRFNFKLDHQVDVDGTVIPVELR